MMRDGATALAPGQSETIIEVRLPGRSYPIVIGEGLVASAGRRIAAALPGDDDRAPDVSFDLPGQRGNIGVELHFGIDQRSDIFSLGVVLYELLTGQRPFTADNMDSLITKITEIAPTPPTKLRSELPREIDAILFRALAKTPEQRYPTWTEFSLALTNLVEKVLPPGVIPDSEKYVALKRVPMLSGLSDSELWELALAGKWSEVPAKKTLVKEDEKGLSFFLVGKGQVKVTRKGRLLNTLDERECFGEMAYIRGGEMPRHATVESVTELLLAEFDPETLAKMSLSAQLHLTRALVRNLVDRLEAANMRIAH